MSETFKGFEPPTQNWTKMPHALIESMHLIETVGEMKVIYYILRHTWGYHDSEKKITLDEFANGRKKRDGSRIDPGTGLSTNTIRDGIERAIKHGFILCEEDRRDLARVKHYYRLRSSGDQKLTPRVSEVDSLGSEVDNRSEKETRERNKRNTQTPTGDFQKPTTPEPFPTDSNFPPRGDLPEIPPITGPRDYTTDVMAHIKRGTGKNSPTIPYQAGGADPYMNGPLTAACTLLRITPEVLGDKGQRRYANKIREIVTSVGGGTPELFIKACKAWSKHGPAWKGKECAPYPNVFVDGFGADMTHLMRQILSGTISGDHTVRIRN